MSRHDFEDRWTDNAPCCPYCGRRVKSSVSRECDACARGDKPSVITEPASWRPEQGFYPPIRLTPDQLMDWRVKCDQFDEQQKDEAAKRGEPTTLEPDRDEEFLVRK